MCIRDSFKGKLIEHPRYGWQYHATSYDSVNVQGKSSLVHYLSSDIFEGIGQKTAEKIVDVLGDNAIDVILRNRQALDEVPKLSKKLADKLYSTLIDQQGTEQILAPLYGYDLSPKLVMKIFKKYQYQALEIINEKDVYKRQTVYTKSSSCMGDKFSHRFIRRRSSFKWKLSGINIRFEKC